MGRRPPLRHALTALVLCAVCAVLAACGDGTGSGGGTTAGPVTVSLTVPNVRLNYSVETTAGFEFGAAGVPGVSAEVRGPDIVDGAAQLRMFEELTARSIAGAAVFTLNPEIFAGPLSAAATRGIPLVAVDNPPAANSGVRLFVGNDNADLGRRLAEQVVALLPEDTRGGTVVIGTTSPGAVVLEQRITGMREQFRKLIPGVTVLGPFDTKQEVESNRAAWEMLVEATPDALAFVGTGDADALNLGGLRQERKGTWLAGGFDLEPESLAAVKRGDLVLMSPEHYLKGAVAGRLLAQRARNGTPLPEGWIVTPGLSVTPANVDEVLARQAGEDAREKWFGSMVAKLVSNPPLRPMPSG